MTQREVKAYDTNAYDQLVARSYTLYTKEYLSGGEVGTVVARHGYTRLEQRLQARQVERARSGECDTNEDWPKRGPLYSEYSRANGIEVMLSHAFR